MMRWKRNGIRIVSMKRLSSFLSLIPCIRISRRREVVWMRLSSVRISLKNIRANLARIARSQNLENYLRN